MATRKKTSASPSPASRARSAARPRSLLIQDWHVHFIGRDGRTYYMNSFGANERAARKHARENPPLVGIREILFLKALPPRTLRFVDPSARKKVKPAAPPMKPRPIDPDDDFEARFGRDPQRGGNGLSQKLRPSAALARIVGARPLTRGQVMKQLWTYIKYHHLQDKRDGRVIRLDANLRRIFPSRGRTIEMFQMTRAVQRHLQRASPRSVARPRQRARARRKSYSRGPRRDPETLHITTDSPDSGHGMWGGRTELREGPDEDAPSIGFINWNIKGVPRWLPEAGRYEAYIHQMMISRGQRRQGLGTRFYRAWEQKLPERVRYVTLNPHGGRGSAAARFWLKQGFSWRYLESKDSDAPENYEMIKGVGGTPTPPPFDPTRLSSFDPHRRDIVARHSRRDRALSPRFARED